jgi:hypothetical protein
MSGALARPVAGIQQPNSMSAALARALQPMPEAPPAASAMPQYGPLPGKVNLNAAIAPKVPEGAPRPFAPGEWVQNPNGSWSSEITGTVSHPELNGGKPTLVPTLWLIDGKPVRVDEDTAAELAVRSGLKFRSYETEQEAEAASIARENGWQSLQPQQAGQVPPLWDVPK